MSDSIVYPPSFHDHVEFIKYIYKRVGGCVIKMWRVHMSSYGDPLLISMQYGPQVLPGKAGRTVPLFTHGFNLFFKSVVEEVEEVVEGSAARGCVMEAVEDCAF